METFKDVHFWEFALPALAFAFLVLGYVNIRRDVFFKKMATQYGFSFMNHRQPAYMKRDVFYPLRTIEGNIKGKNIKIEDAAASVWLPSLALLSNIFPRPLFGSGLNWVKTKFYIDGQEQKDVYMRESWLVAPNFVAPKSKVEAFLKNL